MCNGINSAAGLVAPMINASVRGSIATLTVLFAATMPIAGFLEKALTKDNKYSVNGTIQSSGTASISVETNVVTANIRLDGTNDKNSQRNLRRHVGRTTFAFPADVVAAEEGRKPRKRAAASPHSSMPSTKTP